MKCWCRVNAAGSGKERRRARAGSMAAWPTLPALGKLRWSHASHGRGEFVFVRVDIPTVRLNGGVVRADGVVSRLDFGVVRRDFGAGRADARVGEVEVLVGEDAVDLT
jgi:hypothetical protein